MLLRAAMAVFPQLHHKRAEILEPVVLAPWIAPFPANEVQRAIVCQETVAPATTSIKRSIGKQAMPDPSSSAITAVDVRKSFGDNVVLDGLELTIEPGSVFALLGPNGAGKTTRCESSPLCARQITAPSVSPDTTSGARPTRSATRSE
jgi:ABC-type multidrug transport system fused ATPase/permease subunit